jgi:hypothetical protein
MEKVYRIFTTIKASRKNMTPELAKKEAGELFELLRSEGITHGSFYHGAGGPEADYHPILGATGTTLRHGCPRT